MPAESRPGDGEPFERRLATILMADIVGYSRLMETNEERTLRVFRGHREIFDALLAQHRGRIFNTAGDAVLAEFPSAVEAVRCATEIQSALATRNDHLAPDERMQFRIGVNLGDVIVQGTDLLGDGVNLAARIQTAAPPGGVCVAGSVYDQIRNKLSLEFHPMGERTFKNISQPVRVFSIGDAPEAGPPGAGAAGAGTTPPATVAPAPGPSRPVAAIAAGVVALALAAGGGWWYVQDRESKAAEAARAAEARAAEQVRAAVAATRKAEDDATARVAAEREARLKSELEAAQREAADAKKRAEAARVAATPAPRTAAVAPAAKEAPVASAPATASGSPPKGSPDAAAANSTAASAAPAAAPPSTPPARSSPSGAGTASADFPNDGIYRGRACWELPGSGKGPACWNLDLTVAQNRIDSSWVGSYGGGKPSTIRGQLTSGGQVNALFEGYAVRGNSVSGDVSGRVNEGRMTLSSSLPNRAVITATATRIR